MKKFMMLIIMAGSILSCDTVAPEAPTPNYSVKLTGLNKFLEFEKTSQSSNLRTTETPENVHRLYIKLINKEHNDERTFYYGDHKTIPNELVVEALFPAEYDLYVSTTFITNQNNQYDNTIILGSDIDEFAPTYMAVDVINPEVSQDYNINLENMAGRITAEAKQGTSLTEGYTGYTVQYQYQTKLFDFEKNIFTPPFGNVLTKVVYNNQLKYLPPGDVWIKKITLYHENPIHNREFVVEQLLNIDSSQELKLIVDETALCTCDCGPGDARNAFSWTNEVITVEEVQIY